MFYTIGYAGLQLPDVARWLEANHAIIGDTRIKRWSKDEQWREYGLRRALPGRYVVLEGFGNRLYKETDPDAIDMVDPARAVEQVVDLTEQGLQVVLMCGCWSWTQCHRRAAAELCRVRLGLEPYQVVHLRKVDVLAATPTPEPPQTSLPF